ncbi:GNAT family N-acetyltransferase [Sporohalobacter salinus]|uniref:GNAT family N-acetyltransferase n=1 Tax=Sporohalobacter salinus TaxID=1494606 RepID=UPI00195FEC1B|nr:GNAT family N-acetyltransferase [Sporohalobacter salinus]MBM7624242.1 ElaA protein [Sporohalobacter salinus]
MEWHIKFFNELTTKELYNIIQERINVFVVEQECPYFECDGKDNKSFHLYAKEDDQIVAYARVLLPGISYKEASIGRVLVNKENRGNGLARELMKRAMDFITEELQQDSIKISGQEYLTDFYKSLGFKVVSDVYLEDGIPHLDMLYNKY